MSDGSGTATRRAGHDLRAWADAFPPWGSSLRERLTYVESALHHVPLLNRSQRDNVLRMAEDLALRRLVWRSVPLRMAFEFDRRCNLRCIHCDVERRGTQHLTLGHLERLLDEIGWGLLEVMPFLGGEPTLAPVHEAASLLRRHDVYLNFITNGLRFGAAYFRPIADVTSRVQFSLHTHRPELYRRIAPGLPFERVTGNIRSVARLARETGTHVAVGIVPLLDMLDHMADYVRFVASLGVHRLVIQKLYTTGPRFRALDPNRGRDPTEVDRLWLEVGEVARSEGVFLETNVRQLFEGPRIAALESSPFDVLLESAHLGEYFQPGFCISTAGHSIVEWDGSVLPCCREHIVLGNLHGSSFDEIWNGEDMQRLRRSHFEAAPRPTCRRCREFYCGHP